jgi:tetratricopeptide (TPR) repeat protein
MENAIRRSVSEHYLDLEGKKQTRASGTDFETLPSRHIDEILNLPGFQEDKELIEWIGYSRAYYDQGEYAKAQQYLKWSLKRMPVLEPYIFYYIKVCEHVLSIPLTKEEVQYEAKLSRYRALPKWLRWTMPGFEFRMRCKWCGRYIRYIHPDVPTFGFDTLANSCLFCSRMYPMPSWMWDSPDGRAYSYYRMSFSGDDFYKEFEQGYDPTPLCQHRRK